MKRYRQKVADLSSRWRILICDLISRIKRLLKPLFQEWKFGLNQTNPKIISWLVRELPRLISPYINGNIHRCEGSWVKLHILFVTVSCEARDSKSLLSFQSGCKLYWLNHLNLGALILCLFLCVFMLNSYCCFLIKLKALHLQFWDFVF